MLIILPSSETKLDPPARGWPMDPETLSFPSLAATRERLLDALIATSQAPDALERVGAGPSLGEEVARNTAIRALRARSAIELYTGVVHDALAVAELSTAARRRLAKEAVVASALFGLLRPGDRIPPYRLDVAARLLGSERLEAVWRPVLPQALAEAAAAAGVTPRKGVILDLRAQSYQALGRPAGLLTRLVALQVDTDLTSGRRAPSYAAKLVRGAAARHVLESGQRPGDPASLAALLGERWPYRLEPPAATTAPWTLTLALEG